MRNLGLMILTLGIASSAWANAVFEYTDISRKPGGSVFTEETIDVSTDQIILEAIRGRVEVEQIQVYSSIDETKLDLNTLRRIDSRNNEALANSKGFINIDSSTGEPNRLVLYLGKTVAITYLSVQLESWDADSAVRVKLSNRSTPIPPPQPQPNPGPSCNANELISRIRQCMNDTSDIKQDNMNLESNLRDLRYRVEQQNSQLNQCLAQKNQTESEVIRLETDLTRMASDIRNMIDSNRGTRRQLYNITNPPRSWRCVVNGKRGRRSYSAEGSNRALVLQGLIRKCQVESDDCEDEWNGNMECTAMHERPPADDQDREDERHRPGDNDGRRGHPGRRNDGRP